MNRGFWGPALAAVMMFGGAPAALADVKAGVDAWARGDYITAVTEWQPLARAGDADAQFNLGQAYRLGRGVAVNLDRALDYYRLAAAQGHMRAEDSYGLLLFQQNRRAEAMPYIARAAGRGEPRAQYIYGIALFNGDLATKDWVTAYAMMTRASAGNLPQAAASLGQMEHYIPADQRERGLALARQMAQAVAPAPTAPVVAVTSSAPPRQQPPAPLREAPLPPSAVAAAGTGTGAQSGSATPNPAHHATPVLIPSPPAPTAATPASGRWMVQLGAFRQEDRASTLWQSLSTKVKALSGHEHYLVKSGALTHLRAGPLADKALAQALCAQIRSAGSECIVMAK